MLLIFPGDDRRVKLTEIPGEQGSDYINASFIEDVDNQFGYIAAQGPMPHTVNDFWRMLWEYNTEIVFMACRTKEENKVDHSLERFQDQNKFLVLVTWLI
jgi:protein tyrosine phosphatase